MLKIMPNTFITFQPDTQSVGNVRYFRYRDPQKGKSTHENLYIPIVAADSRLL